MHLTLLILVVVMLSFSGIEGGVGQVNAKTSKSCLPVKCSDGKPKQCAYGYRKKNGCEICKCYDPCKPLDKALLCGPKQRCLIDKKDNGTFVIRCDNPSQKIKSNKNMKKNNSNKKHNQQARTFSSSPIKKNKKWKQHGITVAGGDEQGEQLNQLSAPHGISVDDDQQCIYIADYNNHRIVEWKFDANNGKVVAGGNGKGNQMNQLNYPTDVVVNKKRNFLIICDRGNRRVVEWSRQNGTKEGKTIISDIDCCGITMDNNGDLYVSNTKKNEVRRWKRGETQGVVVAGGYGRGDQLNQFNRPSFLFVDKDQSVYVTDLNNRRVMKWMKGAKEGVIVAGGHGEGGSFSQFYSPQGVIVDQSNNVYVADCDNHRIMCWLKGSKEGHVVVGGNGDGNQSNQVNGSIGISFDRQSHLYVVDWGNHRVQKFEIDNE